MVLEKVCMFLWLWKEGYYRREGLTAFRAAVTRARRICSPAIFMTICIMGVVPCSRRLKITNVLKKIFICSVIQLF